MYLSLAISYWLMLPPALIAAGMLLRVFIIFHDCGHGSFFKSHKANRLLGLLCGVITFTPFDDWKHEHAAHHASAQDLDRRGAIEFKMAAPCLRFNARIVNEVAHQMIQRNLFEVL